MTISDNCNTKGRNIIIVIILTINIYYISDFIFNVDKAESNFIISLVGLIVICAITYLLYLGYKFAFTLVQILLITPITKITFYPLIYSGLISESFRGILTLILYMVLLFYGGIKLEKINCISEFLQSQRSKSSNKFSNIIFKKEEE